MKATRDLLVIESLKLKGLERQLFRLRKYPVLTPQDISKMKSWVWNEASPDEAQTLISIASTKSIPLTDVQTVKGILWLKKVCIGSKGQTLKNALGRQFDSNEVEIIKTFKKFRFIGFRLIQYNPYSNRYNVAPVYKVFGKGGSFNYCPEEVFQNARS